MSDSYTETSRQGWLSRIGGSIKSVLLGLALFLVAFPLLFWNEGRAVKREQALDDGAGSVISVSAETIDAANDGRLVHVTGFATTDETLNDAELGIGVNGLALRRNVEMYQWQEHEESKTEKNVGGSTETTTTYSYDKDWSERVQNSSQFKVAEGHENPASMPYRERSWTASKATLGAYRLEPSLIDRLGGATEMQIDAGMLGEEQAATFKVDDGRLYRGENPQSPAVGDVRIHYEVLMPQNISIVARQVRDSFEPYQTSNGETLLLVRNGTHSAEQMFAAAKAANTVQTWLLRGAGFVLMFIGLGLVFKPLSVIADILPIAGTLVGMGTGLVALLLSAALSSLTIAVAWFFYRPLLSAALIAICVAAFFVLFRRRKKVQAEIPAAA